jgi:hypothetical protein
MCKALTANAAFALAAAPVQVKDLGSGNFGLARLEREIATGELVAIKYIERGHGVRWPARVRAERQPFARRAAGRALAARAPARAARAAPRPRAVRWRASRRQRAAFKRAASEWAPTRAVRPTAARRTPLTAAWRAAD